MKTQVIMKRDFMGSEIRQQSKTEFLNATDIVAIANYERALNRKTLFNLQEFLRKESTKEFINELERVEQTKIINTQKGRNSCTWVHPYLFIKIALAINPRFEVKVYKWLYDSLLRYRNNSGDSYKRMTGALYNTIRNKSKFPDEITHVANKIKDVCKVNSWNDANENQLLFRDLIQDNIAMLSDIIKDRRILISTAIDKAKPKYLELKAK